jgi:MFS family permease
VFRIGDPLRQLRRAKHPRPVRPPQTFGDCGHESYHWKVVLSALKGGPAELIHNIRTLVGATLGSAIGSIALFTYTYGAFITAMSKGLGWSLSQLTSVQLLQSILIAILAPLVGSLMDKGGGKVLIGVGFAAQALIFAALSVAPACFPLFVVLQLAYCVLAIGSSPIGLARVVSERFVRRRGFALACAVSGMGVTGMIGPIFISHVIAAHGWRGGYIALAGVVTVLAPISWCLMFLRRSVRSTAAEKTSRSATAILPLLKRPLFWTLVGSFCLASIANVGYISHLIRLLTARGVSPIKAAEIQGVMGLAILSGRFGLGLLIDNLFAPLIGSVCMLMTAGGMIALSASAPELTIPAVFTLGFTVGAELDLMSYLVAKYFGVANFGKLYGLLYGLVILASGASPVFIAVIVEKNGGYQVALITSSIIMGVAAGLMLLAPRYPRGKDVYRDSIHGVDSAG